MDELLERWALRLEIEELYAAYAECLDDGEIERWPELFTEDGLYKIVPRDNYERNLPLALMLCESRGMLHDRVEALQRSSVYAPRSLRHIVSSLRLKEQSSGLTRCAANYAVFETPLDELTRVFAVGRYLDVIVRVDGALRFRERICILDSVVVPGSLVYPL